MKIGEGEVYPPATYVDEAAKHCRASSGMRSAAIAKWPHKTFKTLVMVRAVTDLVWPARGSRSICSKWSNFEMRCWKCFRGLLTWSLRMTTSDLRAAKCRRSRRNGTSSCA